jgi:small subunit ribosomal protein S16
MGRTHRPFFRLCAVDSRNPRDGRVIEELGHYDPMLSETDARARLKGDRIDYWLSVGAQPSEKAAVLIEKYGSSGTHLEAQQQALERIQATKQYTPAPAAKPAAAEEAPAAEEGADAEAAAEASSAEQAADAAADNEAEQTSAEG